jgi:hypothetical protein
MELHRVWEERRGQGYCRGCKTPNTWLLGRPYEFVGISLRVSEAQPLILRTVFTDIRPDMKIVRLVYKYQKRRLNLCCLSLGERRGIAPKFH